jgi:phage gp36-like protein
MAYASAQDFIDRFGEAELSQLADRDGDGAWDADVVARALADTEAEIDAHLAGRYTLPLAAVPALIVGIACDLARFRLWADATPDRVKAAADNARRLLRAIAEGSLALGLPAASAPVTLAAPTWARGEAAFGGGGLDDY